MTSSETFSKEEGCFRSFLDEEKKDIYVKHAKMKHVDQMNAVSCHDKKKRR